MKKESSPFFQESDIRPTDLLVGQATAMKVDIGRFLVNADRFVQVNCPACDNSKSSPKYEKYALTFVECESCRTIYTNPRPSEDLLEEFYKHSVNYAYWNKHIFPKSEDARRKKIFVPRVDRTLEFCKKYGVATDTLLEIGAAFGTYCVEMASRSIFNRIVAVEPTPGLAQTLRQKNVEVIEDVIENIKFNDDQKFDVVVNFEVIEHIFSPYAFLHSSHSLLKKGGLFLLTCPNGRGFDFQVLGEKCNSLDHEHLNYFNPESLSLLLERTGFEVLETLTPGQLDAELVRKKILSKEISVEQQPFLKQVLIDEWEEKGESFQKFLSDNQLSSNLWIVAKAL